MSPSRIKSKSPRSVKMSCFSVEKQSETQAVFHFKETPADIPNQFPLRSIVRNFTSMKMASQIPSKYLFFILGRLDWLSDLVQQYNHGLETSNQEDVYYGRYIKYQLVQCLSGLGFQIKSMSEKISILGIDELRNEIRELYKKEIDFYLQSIKEGSIVFDGLSELYKPNTFVRGITSLGVPAGFKVVQSYYQERKSLFGLEQSFHLELQYVATLGNDFGVIQFETVLSRWMGESNRKINDLFFAPIEEGLKRKFIASGQKYASLGLGEPKYLQHESGCVFLHPKGNANSHRSSIVQTPGRIMIDVVKGANFGHHASQGMDEASHALIEMSGRYKRFKNEQKSLGESMPSDSIFLLNSIPTELLAITWPALVGFSFSNKSWCHVLVNGLSPIKYNDNAFDELVLDSKRKQLIKALVRFGGDQVSDIIEGKSGGSIFLLHGPAGVGKTLTAEAIAEVLHKPLYYITMGELGIDPTTMENKLSEVLELCAGWQALALIDEADVFLEKRNTSDILKNAMTCVMLRLLEYHPGILFLTTNRVTEFDPALESRVTVALKYSSLTKEARQQVWKNMLQRTNCKVSPSIQFDKLGEYQLNGRQIKNAVRLATAVAMDGNHELSQQIIEETVAVVNIGREEMANAAKY